MKEIMKKSINSDRKYVNILGINVDSTTRNRVLTRVNNFLSHNTRFYIVTPNPELVLMAQDNIELKKSLNAADIAIPDGIGLAQANKFLSLKVPENILAKFVVTFFQGLSVGASTFLNQRWLTSNLTIVKGREIFLDIISLLDSKGSKVFFLGGSRDEAELAALKLKGKFKKIRIETFSGPLLDKNLVPVTEVDRKLQEDAIDRINKFTPDFLFVAMTNPRQEIWIYRNISKLKVKGVMTVGGTFRYIAGLSKLPPKVFSLLGLEWVWRLLTEPQRLLRILNAWPIFPIKIWLEKIKG